jgi:Glycosyl transferase family 11
VIVVDKRGRLGNQMFQYAFGLAASSMLGTWFFYDSAYLSRYFTVETRPMRLGKRAGVHLASMSSPFLRREIVTDHREEPADVLGSLTDRTFYGGFFQSEDFFRPVAEGVRRSFRIRRSHRQRFHDTYGDLVERGYICAHVRLTDYFSYRDDVTLPPGYYRRALEMLDAALPVVVVSDDVPAVAAELGGDPRVRMEANDEIIDFMLLSHASQVIVSNSSFAWWSGWLNKGARVVAPRWWLGVKERRELPVRMIPHEWEQIAPHCPGDGSWPADSRD